MRALIVESSVVNRGILHAQMSNWGMSNRVAATQDQAVELLSEASARGAPFDIAIIDLGLPGMDALDLARTVRASAGISKVRLIMLTRRQADIKNAREAGIDACLAKPVRQTVLYECLVNVMAGELQEAVATPAVSEPASGVPAGSRGSILLVEDNLINQQVALGHPADPGLHRHGRQQRPRGAGRVRAGRLRPDPDGLPHARDGRLRGDAGNPRARADLRRQAHVDRGRSPRTQWRRIARHA